MLGGSLELHVLDPVGEPGLAGQLVSAADAVPGPDGGDRRGVVLLENDSQPVAQLRFDNVDWRTVAPWLLLPVVNPSAA